MKTFAMSSPLSALVFFVAIACSASAARAQTQQIQLKLTYRDQLRLSIGEGLKDVRTCYIDRLLKKIRDRGNITLNWEVDRNGKAVSTKVNDELTTIRDERLVECIREHASKWKFPENSGGSEAKFSFPIWFADKGKRIEISLGE